MRLKNFARAVAFLAALATTSASGVFAAIIFSDDFNKSDQALLGTNPNIGGTWTITGTSTVNPIQIVSNKVALTTTGQDAFAAFSTGAPNATSGFSMVTSADITLSAAQATGDYFLHVSDPAGTTTNFYQRLGAVATTGGYFLTLAVTSGTGATTTPGTTVLNFGTTYHVDVNWNFITGPLNDGFLVKVDGVPYLNKLWDSATAEPTGLSAVNFRQGTATVAPTLTVDNLAVEYLPEPASFSLLLIGALAGLARRRSR